MDKNTLLFLIILITICFGISVGFVSANDNITLNDNLTSINYLNTLNDTHNEIQSVNQDNSKLSNDDTVVKYSNSSENKDNVTINYLYKNKKKLDNIVKNSTKKDRTFKLGKYKLTLSKKDYKKFLYAQFIEKYDKAGKDLTLLEKVFKINRYSFSRFLGTCVTFLAFPYYSVTKKTNKIITQKIGTIKDYKSKNKYFKNYKKAKKFKKQSMYRHKIKYDKKLKKYYIKVDIPVYKKIKSKKARVYLELTYNNNEFQLTTYYKFKYKFKIAYAHFYAEEVIRDYDIYKSSKNLLKLDKSKTKKSYTY